MNFLSTNLRNKRNLVLVILSLIFLLSRIIRISSIPSSVYWDEASIGYNAYSVLQTGKDEWGESFPLHFRAFGEFKLPVYIYSVVPFIKIFGLNAFSVRIPSAIYSSLSIILLYLVAKMITRNERASLFSAFILVVTPWMYIFSRTGYEAVAGLTFYLSGIYFLVKNLDEKSGTGFLFGTFFFILSTYSYNSFRLISPVVLFTFFVLKVVKLLSDKSNLRGHFLVSIFSFCIFFVSLVPVARLYIYDSGSVRMQTVGLEGDLSQKAISFTKNFLSHFSPEFLFFEGDSNLRSQNPGFGQLYYVSFPLLILGLIQIIRKRNIFGFMVVFLMVLGIIPAALTRESPHALRSIASFPFFTVMIAIGLEYLTSIFKKINKKVFVFVVTIYLIFFVVYLNKFFTEYQNISAQDWQLGYKKVFEEYSKDFSNYDRVFIDDGYAQPYIFYLFYNSVDPKYFQESVSYNPPDKWGFSTVSQIGKVHFGSVEFADIREKSLVFVNPNKKVEEGEVFDNIFLPSGEKSLIIYEKK